VAAFLYRVGRFAFRHRWYVALLWVAVLGGVVVAAARAPAAPPDSSAIPGAEFQQANDLIQRSFHANPNGASAQIVFVAPHGQKITAARYQPLISKVIAEAARSRQVASYDSPVQTHQVSRDGSTAIADINYKVVSDSLTAATTNALRDAARLGRAAGLTVEIGGDALQSAANDTAILISLAIAAAVLFITFSALAAAGLPLLTAFVGVGLGLAGIITLGKALGLSSTTQSLALMLGLAVGIDYALFIVSRYREERARGQEPAEAAGFAVGTAGSAVVFSGLTVIIALAGLSVIGIPTVTKMGLAAATTVALAVLVAVTLIPALIGFFPRAVLPRAARRGQPTAARRRLRLARADGGPNLGSRWASFVLRRPVAVLLAAIAALGVIALPATHLRLGEAGNAILPTSDTQRRAYDDIARAFGPGFNGPLAIVVTTSGTPHPKAAAAEVAKKISATPGVVAVAPPQFDKAGDVAVINAVPAAAPDARQTTSLVQAIRAERPAVRAATGASYLVTGLTAANIDIAAKVSSALIPYTLTIVGLAFLLLLIVFRSVLVPLKATVGFVLSMLAALGALVAVFQWGWLGGVLGVPATGPIQSFIPIFLVGISFGLAMDYQIFLVTRVQEAYAHGDRPRHAVISGFARSARIVVVAAVIMISVFAGFITNSDILVKEIGFGLAAAVLLDAFVVRMTIVPAVLALLGKRAWWLPRRLDRALPGLDIDGLALTRRAPATATTGVPAQAAATGLAGQRPPVR
jgi:putative drug exporter of the RND superfamily